jgi:RNA polymerase sigma-70 factor (ECF subfamily)
MHHCTSEPAATALSRALAGHRPYLLRMAARRVRDAALAEDLVQETLLAALQAAPRFEQRSALRTWLTGILLRRCADHARCSARRRECAHDGTGFEPREAAADEDAPPDSAPVDWIDPPRRLEGRQFLSALEHALQCLPAPAARLFALREIDGLDADAAAHEIGLGPRQCALLLHRTRLGLRAALAAHRPHRIRTEA